MEDKKNKRPGRRSAKEIREEEENKDKMMGVQTTIENSFKTAKGNLWKRKWEKLPKRG
jgi:hypothetical protein